MSLPARVFGPSPPDVGRRLRAAAYAVIHDSDGRVVAVRAEGGYFLPGGGRMRGETPEATIAREVREELDCPVRILEKIGDAIQIFHAARDGCWYEMTAAFHRAKLVGEPGARREFDLAWLDPIAERERFFHESYAWAACLR